MSKTKMLVANVSLAALLGTAGWVSSITFPLVAVAQEKGDSKPSAEKVPNFSEAFPPAKGRRIRVGGNVASANLVSKVSPAYPADAKAARIQGTVRLGVLINSEGHVDDVVLVEGPAILVAPSVEAVRQWVYRPTLLNGEPVEVTTVVDVNYTLEP